MKVSVNKITASPNAPLIGSDKMYDRHQSVRRREGVEC